MGTSRNLSQLRPNSAGLIETNDLLDSSVTAAKLANAGAELGARNRLINGSFQINQRGSVAATSGVQYGPDRWLGALSGGTGITATYNSSAFAGTLSGVGAFLAGTWTNGLPYFAQRIESLNSVDLNGRQITVSGKFYQDTGSSQNIVVRISKPTALNNWSGATVVATGSNIAIPTGATTAFSATFTLGASDATNGLMVEVYLASAVTVTSKNIGIADMQLEAGAVATPFDFRQVGDELLLCQRYFQTLGNGIGTALSTTAVARATWPLATHMRVPPSLGAVGSPQFFYGNGTATHSAIGSSYVSSTVVQADLTVTGGSPTPGLACVQLQNAFAYYTASAELI